MSEQTMTNPLDDGIAALERALALLDGDIRQMLIIRDDVKHITHEIRKWMEPNEQPGLCGQPAVSHEQAAAGD